MIQEILTKSPTLSKLFVKGIRLPDPFRLKQVGVQEEFIGKRFPSYFKLGKQFDLVKPKRCPSNKKLRIKYKTDAVNDYLVRDKDPGKFSLLMNDVEIQNFSINLWNGTATLQVKLPTKVKVGDTLSFQSNIEDVKKILPITETFSVLVEEREKSVSSGNSSRLKPPSNGNGKNASKDYLAIPNVREVKRDEWDRFGFEKDSALMVKDSVEDGYDFFINIDNIHLLTEKKSNKIVDSKLLDARYKYGMVLIGPSLLSEEIKVKDDSLKELNRFEMIIHITKAFSPILLPMISGLSKLNEN